MRYALFIGTGNNVLANATLAELGAIVDELMKVFLN